MSLRDDVIMYIRTNILRDPNIALGPEDSLIDAGLLDSVGLTSLISFLESTTGVRIPDDAVIPENFERASSIEALVKRLRQGG